VINRNQINDIAATIGELIGLLTPQGQDGLELNKAWFQDPVTQLEGAETRFQYFAGLVGSLLGPSAMSPPAVFPHAQWYPIPNPETGDKTCFHLVVASKENTSGQAGLGILVPYLAGSVVVEAYVYVPLLSYGSSGIEWLLGTPNTPLVIGLEVASTSGKFELAGASGETVTFTDFNIAAKIFLADQTPMCTVDFSNLTGTTVKGPFTTLESLLQPDVEALLLGMVIQATGWLNTYVGNAQCTVGDILEAAGFLARNYLVPEDTLEDDSVKKLVGLLTATTPDPVSGYVWSTFSATTQRVLKDSSSTTAQRKTALSNGLTSLVQGSLIFTADRFRDVVLIPQAGALLTEDAQGADLIKLNRLLLQSAYPGVLGEKPYSVDLSQFNGTASDIALNFVFAALNVLSQIDFPLVTLPYGGIYVSRWENKDGSNDYGLRLACQIDLGQHQPAGNGGEGANKAAPGSPEVSLCIGRWFANESVSNSWLARCAPEDSTPDLAPGLSIFALHRAADNSLSFAPRFVLSSAGFNIAGAQDTPLLDIGGVTLKGTELRVYVDQEGQFGFGARLDSVGIPLGSSFTSGVTSSSGNPVAKNLVTSGDNAPDSSGGDAATGKKDAVNPQFSLEAAYVSGTGGTVGKWFVDLLPPNDAKGDIIWFPVSRKFGPIVCEKVGIGWNQTNKVLDLVLDGGVSLSGLSAELIELSVGIPLNDPSTISKYSLDLKGIDVSYIGAGVEIQGGLKKTVSNGIIEYDGLASIKVGDFGIGALGSYASLPGGGTSLFIFAILDAPLGGPAAFFATGLALGFGYNRSLIPPAFDKVADFPLLKGMQDPSALGLKPGEPPDLSSVLTTLKDAVPPKRGEYWLAAGVKFTSFELIKSNVLLAVEFGNDFEIMILGTSVLSLPQESSVTMAYAELEIEVLIEPQAGVIEASAVLSANSYVLDRNCHLTGGFAFYLWFGPNEHAGDFVLTIGGYHPAFKKPAWYPDVPRLGFNWKISDSVEITGGAYFALTPSCVMAGGSLKLLYSAGSVNAWFVAYADMLISWKPFFYDISIGVSIGVSVKVDFLFLKGTIKLEVGADVEIWGPPTGGEAHVHLWVVSFTIRFGPHRSTVQTITDWDGFKQMLPSGSSSDSSPKGSGGGNNALLANNRAPMAKMAMTDSKVAVADTDYTSSDPVVCQISYAGGVTSTITNDQKQKVWVVDPSEFAFNISTTTPVTDATLVTQPESVGQSKTTTIDLNNAPGYFVGARPMGVSDLKTPLTITITGDLDADWAYTVQKSDVPEALWGKALPPGSTPQAAATLLLDRVIGVRNFMPQPHTPEGPPVIDIATAFGDVPVTPSPEKLPLEQAPTPQGTIPTRGVDSYPRLKQIMNSPAVDQRSALFAAFQLLGVYGGPNGNLDTMAGDPYFAYSDAPMTGSLVST
jgi:hypothetical protein